MISCNLNSDFYHLFIENQMVIALFFDSKVNSYKNQKSRLKDGTFDVVLIPNSLHLLCLKNRFWHSYIL
jgi:hypothetical protein